VQIGEYLMTFGVACSIPSSASKPKVNMADEGSCDAAAALLPFNVRY